MPSLLNFFTQFFVNRKSDVSLNLKEHNIFKNILPFILQKQLKDIMDKVSKVARDYKLWWL